METEVTDVGIEQMLHRRYPADLNNHCPSKKGDITGMSVEDRSFITLVKKECSKEGKHYKLPLPLPLPPLIKCSQITEAWLKQD